MQKIESEHALDIVVDPTTTSACASASGPFVVVSAITRSPAAFALRIPNGAFSTTTASVAGRPSFWSAVR